MIPPPMISKMKGLIPLLNIALYSAQSELFVHATSEDNAVREGDYVGHEKKHMAQIGRAHV